LSKTHHTLAGYLALSASKYSILLLPAVGKTSALTSNLTGCKSIVSIDNFRLRYITWQGVGEVLDKVIADVPAPTGTNHDSTRALIFDSYYDDYREYPLFAVVDGQISKNSPIKMLATSAEGIALEMVTLIQT